MGYQYGATCYASAIDAATAYAANFLGSLVTSGGVTYAVSTAMAYGNSGTQSNIYYVLSPVQGGTTPAVTVYRPMYFYGCVTGENPSLTVKDAFGTATPEQYAAMGTVFGVVLAAAAVIWGAKRILYLFRHPNEA